MNGDNQMSLKDQFEKLKNKNDVYPDDIASKINKYLKSNNQSLFKDRYSDDTFAQLIGDNTLLNDKKMVISSLLKGKSEKTTDQTEKQILSFLSKVIRKKVSAKSLPSKLAIGAVEQLLLAAYVSKDINQKKLLLNKSKSILGYSQSLTESMDLRPLEKEIFSLNEFQKIEVHRDFKDSELAQSIVDGMNSFETIPDIEKRLKKYQEYIETIDNIINSNEPVDAEDIEVLIYYKGQIESKIEHLEREL